MNTKEQFSIWTPTGRYMWSTTCDYTARQEYACGMVITVLRNGKHVKIKPEAR